MYPFILLALCTCYSCISADTYTSSSPEGLIAAKDMFPDEDNNPDSAALPEDTTVTPPSKTPNDSKTPAPREPQPRPPKERAQSTNPNTERSK